MPWTESGAAMMLAGALLMMAQAPVPVISPAEVDAHEGRTVRVAGFVQDVQVGTDSHRGTVVADGHAVRFHADGTDAPYQEGSWVELRGTLHRDHGRLLLRVESDAWIR